MEESHVIGGSMRMAPMKGRVAEKLPEKEEDTAQSTA